MPVSFVTTESENEDYLIPAPFVSINKSFDKQGDGEILGAKYSITLTGFIVADRGSPNKDGDFITDGVDVITPLPDGDDWYASIQKKQKAIANLISKVQSGALLEVRPPQEGDPNGFSCYVKLESVDLPTHNPGDPFKAEYTINLTTDHLFGPVGKDDEDDVELKSKWLISAASETFEIQESENAIYKRHGLSPPLEGGSSYTPGEEDEDYSPKTLTGIGSLFEQNKTYTLTRTSTATGKNKFLRSGKAEGLKSDGTDTGTYDQIYAANGKAWQQARGYIYDQYAVDTTPGSLARGYGHRFLFGANDNEYTFEGAVPTGIPVEDKVTGDPEDADDIHLFAMNLPVPSNITGDELAYKAYNYKRTQSSDIKAGTFTVVETWTLAPKTCRATESIDFSLQEDTNTGVATITVNGSIQGLLDNADNSTAPHEVGNNDNADRPVTRKENVKENFHYEGSSVTTNSKWQNAIAHYEDIMPFMFKTVEGVLNDLTDYDGVSVNPIPQSKTVSQQIGTGTITYSISFQTTQDNFIPYVRFESFNVNDTYPGHVAAQHAVLGRRIGPVMQSIGTQTLWQRDLQISGNFDVIRENICVDQNNQITTIGTEAKCIAANAAGFDDEGDAIEGAKTYTWVENPNYVNIPASLPKGTAFSTDMITAKPGDANTGEESSGSCKDDAGNTIAATTPTECEEHEPPGNWTASEDRVDKGSTRRIQANAIKQLIDSLDPNTYLIKNTVSGAARRVRKRFTNAPQESWDMKTGAWSYSVSWIYEINDPWAFPTGDFKDPHLDGRTQDDGLDIPYPGQTI